MGLCTFRGCCKPRWARGFCQGHYRQLMDGRPLRPLRRYGKTMCEFEGCGEIAAGRGLCRQHWAQRYRFCIPLKPIRHHASLPTTCSECGAPRYASGLCVTCYGRWWRRRQQRRMEAAE